MSKIKSALWAVLLVVTWQMAAPPPVQAGTGNAAPMTWYSQREWDGFDWKVVFIIPSSVRKNGYVVQSNRYTENLVVSGSTLQREWYGGGWDKVTMTTGYRARFWMGYEIFPYSNLRLNTFAKSLRIYYWW